MESKLLKYLILGLFVATACSDQEDARESNDFHSSSYSIGDEFLIQCFLGSNIAASLLLTSNLDDPTEVGSQDYLQQVEEVSDQYSENFLKRARRIIDGKDTKEMEKNSLAVLDYCERILSEEKPPVIQSLEVATASIARKMALENE